MKLISTFKKYVIILLAIFGPTSCYAANVNTEIFFDDIKKCETFIDKQYKLLMDFMDLLSPADVKSINGAGDDRIEIKNPKAVSAFQLLVKSSSPHEPKGVKFSDLTAKGFPKNIFHGNLYNISSYGGSDGFMAGYEITREDYNAAITNYSNYIIFLLDKIQALREKANSIGLTIYRFPTINNDMIEYQGDRDGFHMYFTKSFHPMLRSIPGRILNKRLLGRWQMSCENIPELYLNKSALTAQKIWIEYVLSTDDLSSDREGHSYKKEFMTELAKIKTFLEKFDNNTVQKQENTTSKIEKNISNDQSVLEPKGKFKLALPE